MDTEMLREAINRYLIKRRNQIKDPTGYSGNVPGAPPVAMRQNSGMIPPRLHKRQPQKGVRYGA